MQIKLRCYYYCVTVFTNVPYFCSANLQTYNVISSLCFDSLISEYFFFLVLLFVSWHFIFNYLNLVEGYSILLWCNLINDCYIQSVIWPHDVYDLRYIMQQAYNFLLSCVLLVWVYSISRSYFNWTQFEYISNTHTTIYKMISSDGTCEKKL